jgi:hypothetical protein
VSAAPAKAPCKSCPYRRDVPSGVWAESEYKKLPAYDREIHYQPPTAFFCHQQNGKLCAGWCGTHDMDESLGLHIAVRVGLIKPDDYEAALDYVSPVPLFSSGAEAAEHGLRDLEAPSDKACRTIDRLTVKANRRNEK